MRHLTKIMLALMLVVAVACSRAPARGPVAAPGPGANSQLGDSRPHQWTSGHPYGHDVHGIDISRWQGNIDWNRVRTAGISFAYIKATEGADHSDPAFPHYWRAAGDARIPRGAYHYYYFCRSCLLYTSDAADE